MPIPLRATIRAVQAVAVGISLYQSGVTVAGYARRPARIATLNDAARPRFGVVICARNEGTVIADLLDDLREQDYPGELRRTVVVAHNCTDDTEEVARCHGAEIVRLENGRAGKVQPMQAALEYLGEWATHAVVLDADARVKRDFLARMAPYTMQHSALQAETLPAAPHSEVERAYGFGRQSRNVLWWRPRARLGLGTTMTGSGFVVERELFKETLPQLRSGTDDLELTVRLMARGERVHFVEGGLVTVEEPGRLGASLEQRSRWVRGHMGTIARAWPRLLQRAVRGDAAAFDLAIFLLVPTRVLTRAGVTFAALVRYLAPGSSIMAGPIALAALAELLIPVVFCWRAGVLRTDREGIRVAIDHVLLGMLWFPVGAWSVITARRSAWSQVPRQYRGGRAI